MVFIFHTNSKQNHTHARTHTIDHASSRRTHSQTSCKGTLRRDMRETKKRKAKLTNVSLSAPLSNFMQPFMYTSKLKPSSRYVHLCNFHSHAKTKLFSCQDHSRFTFSILSKCHANSRDKPCKLKKTTPLQAYAKTSKRLSCTTPSLLTFRHSSPTS